MSPARADMKRWDLFELQIKAEALPEQITAAWLFGCPETSPTWACFRTSA